MTVRATPGADGNYHDPSVSQCAVLHYRSYVDYHRVVSTTLTVWRWPYRGLPHLLGFGMA